MDEIETRKRLAEMQPLALFAPAGSDDFSIWHHVEQIAATQRRCNELLAILKQMVGED
jgi:hypothetical protein